MTIQVKPFPAKKALALFAPTAQEILHLVPKGIVLKDGPDQAVVAVPHSPDVVHTLTINGVKDVPTPLSTIYTFPGRFQPFEAQRATADFAARVCRNSLNGPASLRPNFPSTRSPRFRMFRANGRTPRLP